MIVTKSKEKFAFRIMGSYVFNNYLFGIEYKNKRKKKITFFVNLLCTERVSH